MKLFLNVLQIKSGVSFSSSQSLLSKFSNQNSFSHIRRSSSIGKVQGTVYYIEIRSLQISGKQYKARLWKGHSKHFLAGSNHSWCGSKLREKSILFLSKLCLRTHLGSNLFGVIYMFFVCLIWDSVLFTEWMSRSSPQFP